MRYAKIVNDAVSQYPISGTDIKLQNPETSFPVGVLSQEIMEAFGCFPVVETSPPIYDLNTQRLEELPPVLNQGIWTQVWSIVELNFEEIAQKTQDKSEQIRKERNNMLALSDWTQVADAPVDKAAWAAYRQALRNITTQSGFPWTLEWPVAP